MNSLDAMPVRRRAKPPPVWAFGLLWAAAGLLVVLLHSEYEWEATAGVLMIAQAFSGTLVWYRFHALRLAVLPDFLTLVLFNHLIAKTLGLLGVLVNSMNDSTLTVAHELARLGTVAPEYQFQAELVFLLAIVIFTAIWKVQEGKKLLAMWAEPPSKAIWATYAVGLIGYLSLLVTGLGVGLGMIQELLRMFALGAVAVLLAGTSPYALGRPKALLAILALMPLFLLALKSGMKAEIGLVALPILLPVFRRITALRVASMAGFLLFVVLFIFPFSQAWREANWYQRAESQKVDVAEVSSRVVAMWEQNGLLETAEVSTARWLSRGSTADSGGLVMQLADRDGSIGPVLIEGLVTIFVPRFLWPDKPTYTPGAWFTWYLGYATSPETATTSTAMMLPTELYWMFGLAGVVLGMALLSVIYFNVWRFMLKKSKTSIIFSVAPFAMLGRSGMEEVHTIYAVSSPIILAVYVLGLDFLQRRLFPRFGRRMNVEENQ